MLIISFDSIGDKELDRLAQYPTISSFIKSSAVFRDVRTVFVSNTYPIHASVITGVTPGRHGVTSNMQPFPKRYSAWNNREDNIRVKTLWQAAEEQGIKTAAVFWPVTAYSKTISYNIPEVMAPPGKSQLLTSLKAGSVFLQIKMFLRYRKLLDGINQPNLDNFSTACMADILREYNPGLALVHLTAYDSLCHKNGKDSDAVTKAYEAMDKNLAILLEAAGDRDVIIFSDHSQINVHTVVEPNIMLAELGLLSHNRSTSGDEYQAGESGCFIECCGGSAFFHAGKLEMRQTEEVREKIAASEWFRRFLSDDEMCEAGYTSAAEKPPVNPSSRTRPEGAYTSAAFGFCAKEGFCFDTHASIYKGNHGYPLDMPDYKVFYIVRGSGFTPGTVTHGESLLDIAPLAAKLLGIELKNF